MTRVALCFLVCWPGLALAANISVELLGAGKPAIVFIAGRLETGDYDRFLTQIGSLSGGAIVAFQSEGGRVIEGIQIGEAIRLKKFVTLVTADSYCASACALAWLGGVRRFMAPTARIGFHAAYYADSGRETGVGNALMGAYLNKIGLPYSAVIYITEASPESMTWLNLQEARARGIDVTILQLPENAPPAKKALTGPEFSPKSVADPVDYLRHHPECRWEPLDRLMCPNRVVLDRPAITPQPTKSLRRIVADPVDYLRRHRECYWEFPDGVMCPK
jgi:hypothetical protein